MDGELHHLEGETDTGTSAGTFHRSDNGLRLGRAGAEAGGAYNPEDPM